MNDEGYQQAIQNTAYQIDRLSARVDNMGGTLENKVMSLCTKGDAYQLIEEEALKLDAIVEVIVTTYRKTSKEVDADISTALLLHVAKPT